MFIFGGIFELTKELNDMVVFDFVTKKFMEADSSYEPNSPEKSRMAVENHSAYGEGSPNKTMKGSPQRRRTMGGASPYISPAKKRLISPTKTGMTEADQTITKDEKKKEKDGLSSPTSISMRDSFIIKNADHSFDQYYQSMKKRKQAGVFSNTYGHDATHQAQQSKFGLINGHKPTARDGHCAVKDS